MTLRRFDRAIMCGLAFVWSALMVVQVTPGVKQQDTTQTISEEQIKPDPVVFYGPKLPSKHRPVNDSLPSRSGGLQEPQFGPWENFVATAYDGVGDGMNGIGTGLTSTGTRPRAGVTVAVDPSVIPYGAEIEVELQDGTIQYLHAEDTGGAIRGNRIDIFNPSRSQCFKFGRQHVRVRIIKGK